MKSSAAFRKILICLVIVGIFATFLNVEAKGKKKNKQADAGPKPDGTTSKPAEAAAEPGATDESDGAQSTTGKPSSDHSTTPAPASAAASTTGHPGSDHSTTAHPGSDHSTTAHPGSDHSTTSHPGSNHTTTGHPGSEHSTTSHPTATAAPIDIDKMKLEETAKLQEEERILLKAVEEKMKAWYDFIDKHNLKSLNKHNVYEIHNLYCNRMVEVYRQAPKQRYYHTPGSGKGKIVKKVIGLHTVPYH